LPKLPLFYLKEESLAWPPTSIFLPLFLLLYICLHRCPTITDAFGSFRPARFQSSTLSPFFLPGFPSQSQNSSAAFSVFFYGFLWCEYFWDIHSPDFLSSFCCFVGWTPPSVFFPESFISFCFIITTLIPFHHLSLLSFFSPLTLLAFITFTSTISIVL